MKKIQNNQVFRDTQETSTIFRRGKVGQKSMGQSPKLSKWLNRVSPVRLLKIQVFWSPKSNKKRFYVR